MTGLFLPLEDIKEYDLAKTGGKGRNIMRLADVSEVNIPFTWILLPEAFECFILKSFLPEQFGELLREYLQSDKKASLFAEIAHTPFPEKLEKELVFLLPKKSIVIIRSSGIFEDSGETSLAGHYESIISHTEKKELIFSIKSSWAVALRVFLDHIYRDGEDENWEQTVKKSLNSVALVFQDVIDAERSGIYFSQSPSYAYCSHIVSNWGTCHSIVSGKTACDEYILNYDGSPEKSIIRYKHEMTVLDKQNKSLHPGKDIKCSLGKTTIHYSFGNCIYMAHTPHPYNKTPVLNKDDMDTIHNIAMNIKEFMGYEIDMEWSISKDKFFILQVRPITTSPFEGNFSENDYIIASPGIARGPVKIITSPYDIDKVNDGDLIAVNATDPDFMPIFYRSAGIISNEGSPLCHTAIVARELNIPCLLGVRNATSGMFAEGEIITIDACEGSIFKDRDGFPGKVKKKFKRNKIVYDLSSLPYEKIGTKTAIAFSAILYGYLFETNWAEPDVDGIVKYMETIKKKYDLKAVSLYWDVNNHNNSGLEIDDNLMVIKKYIEKRVF